MSDKFKLLLKQIHFPQHEEAYNEIKSGSIESVKLFKSKRQWFFVFSFRNLLSYETFTLFDNLLHSSFDSLGAKVSYMINVEDISCDQSLLEAYFSYALDILKSSHFSIYSLFSNLGIEISNNSISVKAPAHILRENLHERFIALIADVLSNVGLSNVRFLRIKKLHPLLKRLTRQIRSPYKKRQNLKLDKHFNQLFKVRRYHHLRSIRPKILLRNKVNELQALIRLRLLQ